LEVLEVLQRQIQGLPHEYLRCTVLDESQEDSDEEGWKDGVAPDGMEDQEIAPRLRLTDNPVISADLLKGLFHPAHFEDRPSRSAPIQVDETPRPQPINLEVPFSSLYNDEVVDCLGNLSRAGCRIELECGSYPGSDVELAHLLRAVGAKLSEYPYSSRTLKIEYTPSLYFFDVNKIRNAGRGYTITVSDLRTDEILLAGCYASAEQQPCFLDETPRFTSVDFDSALTRALAASRKSTALEACTPFVNQFAVRRIDVNEILAWHIVDHFVFDQSQSWHFYKPLNLA
jgi:hypothetical protein